MNNDITISDISTVTGQELPSSSKLTLSTLIALGIAAIILIVAILPAEYGLDPTGLGKRLGLTTLHQNHNSTVSIQDAKWRSETRELTLAPKQNFELKALMNKGEHLMFQWQASGGTVSFDMHGNKVGADDDDYDSYWRDHGYSRASGSFEAPYAGLHGWYWENEGDQPVKVTLEVSGYYQKLK